MGIVSEWHQTGLLHVGGKGVERKMNGERDCPMCMKPKSAFTLIELLVVIAIIVILVSLIIPPVHQKRKAKMVTCMSNLRQIGLGITVYADDARDSAPKIEWTTNSASMYMDGLTAFKKLLGNQSLSNMFSCPEDTFYFTFGTNAGGGYTQQSMHSQASADYSSYGFNGGQMTIFHTNTIGIAGRKLSSIKKPTRTVMVAELPAYFPWSWHMPMGRTPLFDDAKDMIGFVDGHVSFSRIYWNTNTPHDFALEYNPPAGYDYQWSGD